MISTFLLSNSFNEFKAFIKNNLEVVTIFALGLLVLLFLIYYLHERKTLKRIKEIAFNDNLCKVKNRNGFIRDGERLGNYCSVVCFDINNFRNLNLSNGYDFGDKLLKNIAKLVDEIKFEDDVVARIKDDTFAILSKIKNPEQLSDKFNEFMKKISSMYVYFFKISFSVGICVKEGETNIAKMLDEANIARQASKKSGRSQIVFFDEKMVDIIDKEVEICDNLRYALIQNEFNVYYQPKFDVITKRIVASEALVRWTHRGRSISPAIFVPIAEKRQLIVDIDRIVFERVCQDIKKCMQSGQTVYPVSINFSKADLYSVDMLEFLEHMIEKYEIPVQYLEVEITETLLSEDMTVLQSVIGKLKNLGLSISLDDFGSGYSSLSFLEAIPVDVIKIDRSLLLNTQNSEKSKIILQQVVALSKQIGLMVVCEGVETEEQLEYLKEIGCDYGQGYIFSKAVDFNTYFKKYYKTVVETISI